MRKTIPHRRQRYTLIGVENPRTILPRLRVEAKVPTELVELGVQGKPAHLVDEVEHDAHSPPVGVAAGVSDHPSLEEDQAERRPDRVGPVHLLLELQPHAEHHDRLSGVIVAGLVESLTPSQIDLS